MYRMNRIVTRYELDFILNILSILFIDVKFS